MQLNNAEDIYIILGLFMFFMLIITWFFLILYRLKTIRKIDIFLLSIGINQRNFNGAWGRYIYYCWAIFWPQSYVNSGRASRTFDPFLVRDLATKTDKFIIKAFGVSFVILFTLFFIVRSKL